MIGAELRAPQWLVEVLADHGKYEWWPITREFICSCEASIGRSYPDAEHRTHVATVIAARLAEMLDGSFDHVYDRGEGDAQGYRHRDKQVRTVLGIGGAL